MIDFGKIIGRFRYESSIIFAFLLAAGLFMIYHDRQSLVGMALIAAAVLIGAMGFAVSIVREGYESLIKQKDEMIKTLTKERRAEVKHSEELRRQVESRATGGWEQAGPDTDIV